MIRPIITHGCSIWFKISPAYMEKICNFERKYLRTCTSLNKSSQSNCTKFVSNKRLYISAKINRMDNSIIKLIRKHILKCTECTTNNLILAYYTDDLYLLNTLISDYVPPEPFIYLDKNGFMQNRDGIPLFYHLYRRATNKSFNNNLININELRYYISSPILDSRQKDIYK